MPNEARWRRGLTSALLVAVALCALLAVACGGGDNSDADNDNGNGSANEATPRPTLAISAGGLAALVPTSGAVANALGFAIDPLQSQRGDFGQQFVNVDFEAVGLLDSYLTLFRSGTSPLAEGTTGGGYIDVTLYDTADGAHQAYRGALGGLQVDGTAFAPFARAGAPGSLVDEAGGAVFPENPSDPTVAVAAFRRDRVVVFVLVFRDERLDLRPAATALAEVVAKQIDALSR